MADDVLPRPRVARYGLLLITLIASYLISAMVPTGRDGVIHVCFAVAIGALALRHSRPWSRTTRLVVGTGVVTAVAAVACAASDNATAQGISDAWNAVVLLAVVVIIVDRVLRMGVVTVQSIFGALSAYLLVGLMFAAWFGAIGLLVPGPFFAHGQPATTETVQYFSFVTLTTLGYGDFTAVGSLGRAVAVIEALTGQIFLATLVARLVSAYRVGGPPPAGG